MICPKCGSDQVDVQREEVARTGALAGSGKIRKRGTLSGVSTSALNIHYRTTALCHACGYSWHPAGEDEERNKRIADGCGKGCLSLILLVVAIILFAASCQGSSEPAANTSSASTAQQIGQWALQATPLEDFEFEQRDGVLYLMRYLGSDASLRIPAQYEYAGQQCPVNLEELFIGKSCVKSVVLEDGLTGIAHAAFNMTQIERLYLPATMSPIYDDTLAYIDKTLTDIYYGGSETAWENAFQEFNAGSAQEHFANGEYEEAGAALASDLNDAIGHDFTTDGKTITFNAKISELQ